MRSARSLALRLLPLALGLSGCYSWRAVDLSPSTRFRSRASVRVEYPNGSRDFVDRPRVVGDSLVGRAQASSRPIAVPLADVRRVSELRFSGKRTAILVGVVGAGLAYIAYGVSQMQLDLSSSSSGGCSWIC